jgi:ribosomal protein S18 acetylase RimI-like enzyme
LEIAAASMGGVRGRAPVARPLGELVDDESSLVTAGELIHEAGVPYVDWFFGSARAAQAAIARWIERPSSELAAERIRVVVEGNQVAGLFLAIGGADLKVARTTDTVAALKEAGDRRDEMHQRIATADQLFLPVEPEWFYLSRLAVVPHARRRGLGRNLAEEYLAAGAADGFDRFCLDVSADNEIAVRLYGSFGFEVKGERHAAGMRYLRMALVV